MAGMNPYSDPNPRVPVDTSSVPRPLNAAAVTVNDPVADQVSLGETSTLRSRAFASANPFTLTSGWIWYDIWLTTVHSPKVCISPRINDLEVIISSSFDVFWAPNPSYCSSSVM